MPYDKLTIDTSADVEFLRDDVRYGDHPQYGESWSYYVSSAGNASSLRAYPGLQRALMSAGIGKGATAKITKHVTDAGTRWEVVQTRAPVEPGLTAKTWEGEILEAQFLLPDQGSDGNGAPASPAPVAAAPTSTTAPTQSNNDDLADLARLAKWAIDAAHEAWSGYDSDSSNVLGTASTLLIQASQRRLSPPSVVSEVEAAFDGEVVEAASAPHPESTGTDELPF